jgi:hypothetical protein
MTLKAIDVTRREAKQERVAAQSPWPGACESDR